MAEDVKSTIHPFFSKGNRPIQNSSTNAKSNSTSTKKPLAEASNKGSTDQEESVDKTSRSTRANTKAKRSAGNAPSVSETLVNNLPDAQPSLEVDPNIGRRKRQKITASDDAPIQTTLPISRKSNGAGITGQENDVSWMVELREAAAAAPDDSVEAQETTHQQNQPVPRNEKRSASVVEVFQPEGRSSAPPNREEPDAAGSQSVQASTTAPAPAVKLLRLNPKTGTIGSPPKKPAKVEEVPKAKSSTAKRVKKPKSLIVLIIYGQDAQSKSTIGEKIDRILQTPSLKSQPIVASNTIISKPPLLSEIHAPPLALADVPIPAKSLKPSKPDQPPKATHPFFLGKAPATVPEKSSDAKEKEPTSNSPRGNTSPQSTDNEKSMMIGRVSPTKKPRPASEFQGFSTAQTKTTSFSGGVGPAWPWKGMVHVRGENMANSRPEASPPPPALRSEKKSKHSAIQVLAHEDLLTTFGAKFPPKNSTGKSETTESDEYENPPNALRLPSKVFMSGYQVQRHIRSVIHSHLPRIETTDEESSSEDEIQGNGRVKSTAHPAISRVYKSIATSLSAFDKFECETQSWVQKFAPSSTEEVLQSGKEAVILRDWLQTLTVKLVDTGLNDNKGKRSGKAPRRKKQKLTKALDGFVVSSDEEANEMDEISEPEEDTLFTGARGDSKKTVVRSGDSKGSGKLTNAVVISGPHGSGKTAAIYAVAKELGFEVFELNPGSRRSGRDIMEKVGDMTRNHQVQRSSAVNNQTSLDEEMQSASEALERDLKSGRQGTMNSFFKSATIKAKPKPKNAKAKPASPKPIKHVPKKQKQSLILIEEADVLYEEDKQFWATVITLISQSKRPVIITCTDEAVVPLQSLYLHAIIRFSPAPLDLAVDYMLVIAASEGHILKRNAVKALYESRSRDLRGSITELQFWCQFAVGDPKRGLNWRYSRWPVGSDKDKHNNTVRTISEGAYDTGMGWLGRDFSQEDRAILDIEEETLRQAWNGWHMDAGDWHETLNMTRWSEKLQSGLESKADEQLALNIYDYFADAMSTADICAGHGFASENQVLLDYTAPELSEKARDDFTLGYQLLHADELVSHETLGTELSFWIKSRARETIQVDQFQLGWKVHTEMNHPSENRMIEKIRERGTKKDIRLTRRDLSIAFDPIAEPEKTFLSASSLEPSVFDRTITTIALDVAPFIRSIVSYDAVLQQERLRRSNLVSLGGTARKRKMRTTRSANAAMEGGARKTTRPERYFGNILNPDLVLLTGQPSWQDAVLSAEELLSIDGAMDVA